MAKAPTIYQKLSRVMFGGGIQLNNSDMQQNKNITVNSYNMNTPDDIVFKTTDKNEYEQQLLQKKQQKLLNNMWIKANVQLANNSLMGLNPIRMMYRDADLMDGFPEIGAALDIVSEESCLRGNTKIKLLNGEVKTIEELYRENYTKFYTYSVDENGEPKPTLVERVVCNGLKKLYRITLDDGTEIDCTNNHKWLLSNNSWKNTDELTVNDSMMSIYSNINYLGYEKINTTINRKFRLTHQIVAENILFNDKIKLSKNNTPHQKIVIHHKSFNKLNNDPSQLQYMYWNDHQKLHTDLNKDRWNNDEFSKKMRKIFSETAKKTWQEKGDIIRNKLKLVWENRIKNATKEELKEIYGRCGCVNGMFDTHRYGETNPNFNVLKNHIKDIDENEYINYVITLNRNYRNKIEKHFNLTKESVVIYNRFLCEKYSLNKITELKYLILDKYNIDNIKYIVKNGITQIHKVARILGIWGYDIENCIRLNGYMDWDDFLKSCFNHKIIKIEKLGYCDYVYDLINSSCNHCFGVKCNKGHIISHNCVPNDKSNIINISSKSERVKSILEDLFVNRLDVHVMLPMICRAMCKYGNNFMLLNINDQNGIMGWKQLPVYEMERYEYGMSNPYSTVNLSADIEDVDTSTKFVWVGQNEYIPYRNWQVSHFRLLYDSLFLPYGISYLNKARRHWRMLSLMEDMMLIYRLERSVERRVYKIFVGNIDDADVPAYVNQIADNFKRTPIVDPATGQVDLRKNILDVSQDIFIPVRDESAPNPIDTLPAAQNLTAMDDIKFVQNKVLTALRIPKTFLNFEESTGDGKNLSLMDIRFTRTVARIQQALLMELTKIATIHLYLLGFTDDLTNFSLTMNNPSSQAEMMEIENLSKKIQTAQMAVSDPGNGIPIMSWTGALKKIMKWDDNEISENLKEIRLERALAMELAKTFQIIKKTGLFDPVDRIYGEPGAEYSEGDPNGEGLGGEAGGASGGMPDFGGELDGGMPDMEGEEIGQESEIPMDNAMQDENEAPSNIGEMITKHLSNTLISEKKKISEELKGKQDKYYNRYLKHLLKKEYLNEEIERTPIIDKSFLVNEELNNIAEELEKRMSDK